MTHYQEVIWPECKWNIALPMPKPRLYNKNIHMPYSYKAYEAGTKEQIIEIAIKMVVKSVLLEEGLGKGKLKLLNLGTK